MTWRHLLLCMLVKDFGHLATLAPLGTGVYWRVWEWNVMCWVSIGLGYIAIVLRTCFLLEVTEWRQSAPSMHSDTAQCPEIHRESGTCKVFSSSLTLMKLPSLVIMCAL